ncbi:MAG: hypothetical protein B7Z37_17400 [Verrucomicrobia bacterium 12-59-8]|nr:MAG: hypothetical protein B7Z37_17400 [Verrucomicrobia bacterium 12-59-8]
MKISFLLLAAAFVLASCIEIKSTVIVSKDGTATIEESMLMGVQLAAMMQAGGDQRDQLKGLVMDKEKAEERAQKLGEGVTVKSHEEVKTPDGKSGVKVVFAVADLTKLKYVPFEPEQEDKPATITVPMTFALSGSSLTITNPNADKKPDGDAEKPPKSADDIAMMKSQMAMMKPMFAGIHLAVEVKGANGIASSDATNLSDGTISYLDIQFDKLMENAEAFSSFLESANDWMSAATVAAKFSKAEGLKIEDKKVVTAVLK